jgi:hypothetical protein
MVAIRSPAKSRANARTKSWFTCANPRSAALSSGT